MSVFFGPKDHSPYGIPWLAGEQFAAAQKESNMQVVTGGRVLFS